MKKMAGGSAQFWFLEISINTMIHTSLPIEKMKTKKERFCRRYYVPTARSLCSASQLRNSSDFMIPPRSLSNQNPDVVVHNSRTMAATTTTTMFTNLQSTHDDPNRLPTSRGLENRSFLTGLQKILTQEVSVREMLLAGRRGRGLSFIYKRQRWREKLANREGETRQKKRERDNRVVTGGTTQGGNWREKMTVMRGIVYPSSRTVVSGTESCALILKMHTVDCWNDIRGGETGWRRRQLCVELSTLV